MKGDLQNAPQDFQASCPGGRGWRCLLTSFDQTNLSTEALGRIRVQAAINDFTAEPLLVAPYCYSGRPKQNFQTLVTLGPCPKKALNPWLQLVNI